jgi:hypothetical protein
MTRIRKLEQKQTKATKKGLCFLRLLLFKFFESLQSVEKNRRENERF